MTLRLSTGLRDKLLGMQPIPKGIIYEDRYTSNLAFSDGGGESARDRITDDGNNLITAGFYTNQLLFVYNSSGSNDILNGTQILGIDTSTPGNWMDFAADTLGSSVGFDPATYAMSFSGGSLKDVFMDGVLRIYSGSAPATADAVVTGTLLAEITVSSGTFTATQAANGLEFGDASGGVIAKSSSEVWSGVASASGTAGYFRLLGNGTDNGTLSTTLPRIQGSIGTSGADLNMTSTTITSGATYTIDTFQLTLPAYYGA